MIKGSVRRLLLSGIAIIWLITNLLIDTTSDGLAESSSQASIPSVNHDIFLPLVIRPTIPTFGVESSWVDPNLLDKAAGIRTYWWRYNAFSWKDIEPNPTNPRTYNWPVGNEWALQTMGQMGFKTIATVKYTPSWAQKFPNVSCGPIAEDKFVEFAQFMQALVSRYGNPPYNIKYWEIGNEIDVDPNLVQPDSGYGCWGDDDDLNFYGGEYYAEMLKVVYPAVKAVDPDAKIVIGSLLLYCDPTYDPPLGQSTCLPSKFFEGILYRNGYKDGGNYFDVVGYHGYAQFSGTGKIIDENFPGWEERGGVFLGKLHFLREKMAVYNVQKPVMNTEVALLCSTGWSSSCNPPTSVFYETQADYATWTVVRSIAAGLESYVWYTLNGPGWNYGGLLDGTQSPKPVYNSLMFVTQKLTGALYIGELSTYTNLGLRAYEFTIPGKRLWVLWDPDLNNDTSIAVPTGFIQALNKYGTTVVPNQGQILINSPIYIELDP